VSLYSTDEVAALSAALTSPALPSAESEKTLNLTFPRAPTHVALTVVSHTALCVVHDIAYRPSSTCSISCRSIVQQAVQENPQQIYNRSKAVQQVLNKSTKPYILLHTKSATNRTSGVRPYLASVRPTDGNYFDYDYGVL